MLPFEVAGGDVVKHRIQTGVKGDEGHGDPAGDEDLVGGGATLDDIHSSEKVQQIHNMVGQEAEQRDGQDGVDDPHRPLGCFGLDQGDSPRSQWVTHQDDERGQQRAEDETEHGVCPQARVPLVFGKVLKAAVASWFIHVGFQGSHEDEDEHSHTGHTPQHYAHTQGVLRSPQPAVGVWMQRGDVAIQADTSHEADARVNIGEEQNPYDATGHVPKHPVVVVEVVVNFER